LPSCHQTRKVGILVDLKGENVLKFKMSNLKTSSEVAANLIAITVKEEVKSTKAVLI